MNKKLIINTKQILEGIFPSTSTAISSPNPSNTQSTQTNTPPSTQPVQNQTQQPTQPSSTPQPVSPPTPSDVRVKIVRYLDDTLQTLGILTVYDENGGEMFQLGTTELPWKDNRSYISCIPPGNYQLRADNFGSGKYPNSFQVYSEGGSKSLISTTPGSANTRTDVLIHEGYGADWLQGCISPNQEFDIITRVRENRVYSTLKDSQGRLVAADYVAGNKEGNPRGGIGETYSDKDSRIAVTRLYNALTNNGAKKGKRNLFKMVIQNAPTLVDQLSKEEADSLANPKLGA